MNQAPQTGKRIVSKGEYARTQGKRAQASLIGVTYLLIAILSCFAGASLIAIVGYYLCFPTRRFLLDIFVFKNYRHPENTLMNIVFFDGVGIAALFASAYVNGTFGYDRLKEAARLDPGVPLTRANTADLPAPDSLVRASAEPVQEPQTVLLRAATHTQERHEEQLLRASVEQQ